MILITVEIVIHHMAILGPSIRVKKVSTQSAVWNMAKAA